MGLKTEWLKVIEKLAEHGSVSAAAAELGYTQQALSYTLNLAEQYFKCCLFERRSRSLVLTPEGHSVLALTRKYLKQINDLQLLMQDFQEQGLARKWRVARSNSFSSSHQVGFLMGELLKQFPDYTLALEWVTQHQLEAVMLKENIPLALSFYPAKSASLKSYPIFESPYVWVVHSEYVHTNPLPVIEFAYHYLNRVRQIFHEGSDYTYLSDLYIPENVTRIVSGNMLEILQLLKAGCGKACVPLIDVADAIQTGELTLLETTSEKVTGFLIASESLLPKTVVNWLKTRKLT